MERAVNRTRRFSGAWYRFNKNRNTGLKATVFAKWSFHVLSEPRRAHSPERVLEIQATADRYDEWIEEQEQGDRFNLLRAAKHWAYQISVLGLIHKLCLLQKLQSREVSGTGAPVTDNIWWRIRAFIWLEANNPLCD